MDELVDQVKKRWQDQYWNVMKYHRPNYDRPLLISPYYGDYGLAGYVITIQGSPVHGTAVLDLARDMLTCIDAARAARIVHNFAPKGKQALYTTTIELLDALGLRLEVGGADELQVVIVHSEKE